MRVLLNTMTASGRKAGIGNYVTQLLRCLQTIAPEDDFDEFPQSWLRWCWGKSHQLRPYLEWKKKSQPKRASRPSSGLRNTLMTGLRRAGQFITTNHIRHVCRKTDYDVYHEPNYIPLPCDVPTIATVHDLSILLHPQWHPADRVKHFERHFEKALERCVHFLAISEFGRQEIIRTFNIPPECVTRTYMGVRPGLSVMEQEKVAPVLKSLGLPAQYLLYLGTIEPRKNMLTLLQAYCALPDALRRDWPLLLVGGWGWNTADVQGYLHFEARHRGVIHLGYVPDQHISALYNGARALVFPSFYEGFGLPPTEMMACGGAVLASTAGALIETVGRRAHLIAPLDVDGWREAMQLVLEDDDWWQSLRAGVTDLVQHFTWEQCAADTLKVYRMISGHEIAPSPLPIMDHAA